MTETRVELRNGARSTRQHHLPDERGQLRHGIAPQASLPPGPLPPNLPPGICLPDMNDAPLAADFTPGDPPPFALGRPLPSGCDGILGAGLGSIGGESGTGSNFFNSTMVVPPYFSGSTRPSDHPN